MRLRVSKPSCEERLLSCLNAGYALSRDIFSAYEAKMQAGTFSPATDLPLLKQPFRDWLDTTHQTLVDVFPTRLEANLFIQRFSVTAADYSEMNNEVGHLVYGRIPKYIDRLHRILETQLPRYGDL